MKIFNLPDLGEGLTEAEIHEWHVKEGDTVEADQLLASMETAKAVVDVPAPRAGTIAKLYGKVGDIIYTDGPLVEFTDGDEDDAGSVVGNMTHQESSVLEGAATGIVRDKQRTRGKNKILPAIRNLAKRLDVDLSGLTGTGPHGKITKEDVERAANDKTMPPIFDDGEAIKGVRRTMAQIMKQSHHDVAAVTIVDDADLHAWPKGSDITARVVRAVCFACQQEPSLNAWYHDKSMSRKLHQVVHLGLALDSKDGLFVPVIKEAQSQSGTALRETINRFKQEVSDRSIAQDELQGATITLSNFGSFAGRYANPVIVQPMVAIVGTGRIREEVAANQGNIEIHKIMPLSLTFDHRAVTGGEATRFLAAMIEDLKLAE